MGLSLRAVRPSGNPDGVAVYHPSYSRFDEFRFDVAEFYGVRPYTVRWFRKADPLPAGGESFWWHSDCEGYWTTTECRLVAELLAPYVEAGPAPRYRELAERLADACWQMAETGGRIEFW